MNTKLTLRMDDGIIRDAKEYSRRSGKSISRLVSDYLALLGSESPRDATELTPLVRSLHGALAGANVDKPDYRAYLEQRHS